MKHTCRWCTRTLIVLVASGVTICPVCDLTAMSSIPNLQKPKQ